MRIRSRLLAAMAILAMACSDEPSSNQGVVRGAVYTFASTHLESGQLAGLEQLRAAQAGELVEERGPE